MVRRVVQTICVVAAATGCMKFTAPTLEIDDEQNFSTTAACHVMATAANRSEPGSVPAADECIGVDSRLAREQ